jgi:hypothetical protein
MTDRLREYIQAQISVMIREIGPKARPGSKRFTQEAIAWIERNASDFRAKWEREKEAIIGRRVRALRKQYDVE